MKFSWLSAIASVSALVVLAGCGGGAPTAESPEVSPDSASTVVAAEENPLPVVEPAPKVKIGSAIGERAPDFEVTFLDGKSVSRKELAEERKPAFLFFMATW